MRSGITILFICIYSISFSQKDCYKEYAETFEKRGALEVVDNVYDDVVVTIRSGSQSQCLYGKVKVSGGFINTNSIYLKFDDNSLEKFARKYRDNNPVRVDNGQSETLVTTEDELVNIFFISQIKPKKKAYKKAPDPKFNL